MSTSIWNLIERAISEVDRVLLYGPPGTGKTTAATLVGEPVNPMAVTLTEETPAAELRGHFIPKGGEFMWMDGPGVSAMRHGHRLVLNEIDHCSQDCSTLLHVLLDDRKLLDKTGLTLPSGETVRPAPGYKVIATMNGEPGDLTPALRDRFLCIEVETPHPKAIESLPKDLRPIARDTCKIKDPTRRISLRQWKQYDDLRTKGFSANEAAKLTFAERADEVRTLVALK